MDSPENNLDSPENNLDSPENNLDSPEYNLDSPEGQWVQTFREPPGSRLPAPAARRPPPHTLPLCESQRGLCGDHRGDSPLEGQKMC